MDTGGLKTRRGDRMNRRRKTSEELSEVAGAPAPTVSWPAGSSELRPIATLKLRDGNPNKHSLEQIEQISASMQRFGWTIPLLVDEEGLVIAGHGRLRAARLMGYTQAPVVVARGWSDDEKRAYVIADNQLTRNSEWDRSLLRLEVRELAANGFDLTLTALSTDDLQKLSLESSRPETSIEPEDVHMKRCPTCGSLRRKTE